jgi:hypothetical protein
MWNKLKNWYKNLFNKEVKESKEYENWKKQYGSQLDGRASNTLDKIVNDILNGGK